MQSAHAQIIHLTSVPVESENHGYLVMRTNEIEKFYSTLENEVMQIISSTKNKNASHIVYVFLPPRVSERLMEKNIKIFRTEKKKGKRPDVTTGVNHSVVLIRKYTIQI